MAKLHARIIAALGEPAYSAYMLNMMLEETEVFCPPRYKPEGIRRFAKKNGLCVSLEELGITGEWNTKYVIPKSNLGAIIEGMQIPVSVSALEEAAHKLGYEC